MATTNFQTGTLIESTWLNDVDEAVYTTLPDHIADTVDAHDASAISNVAAGNLVATTVQAAIDELDAEKQPLDAQLTTLAGITAQQATDLAAISTFMGTVLNDTSGDAMFTTMGTLKDVTGSDGYIQFPNGVLLQWGVVSTSLTVDVAVTFPKAFAASPFVFIPSVAAGVGTGYFATWNNLIAGSVNIGTYSATSTRVGATAGWIAVGVA